MQLYAYTLVDKEVTASAQLKRALSRPYLEYLKTG